MDIRDQFPSLKSKTDGQRVVFLDGPAGTQVPQSVINAISDYYKTSNANTHGCFEAAIKTDQVIRATRKDVATFLGAESWSTVSFGQNMTTLCYSLAHAIGRILQPGDEILITQLDHEANRGPWLTLRTSGVVVREVRLLENGHLDMMDMASKINERTRLVAMGWASNITGTINDVKLARQLTYEYGAWLLLDAVHYAPHFRMNVARLGCDFLLCSAYKFYGPHVGILYTKTGLLDRLPTDRLRTTEQTAPYSIETGTLNHAALAGVRSAIHFMASLGHGQTLSEQLDGGMSLIGKSERYLFQKLYKGIDAISKATIIGPGMDEKQRAPTLSFVWENKTAKEICEYLAQEDIYAWDGHFYAIRAVEILGLMERGGVTRMGISAYTTDEDINKTLEVLSAI